MIEEDKILLSELAALLAKGGSLSVEQQRELARLSKIYPEGIAFIEAIISKGEIQAAFDIRRIIVQEEWNRFNTLSTGKEDTKVRPFYHKAAKWFIPIMVAASIMLMVGVWWFYNNQHVSKLAYLVEDKTYGQKNDVLPGSVGATLQIAGRGKIELDGNATETLDKGLHLNGGELVYEEGNKVSENPIHILSVPSRSIYQVVLSDGTKVWINSESELEYAAHFSPTERRVKVKGEAYFEVAKDKNRPFMVETNNMSIEAVGTAFNVRSYQKNALVLLTEGRVKVKGKGEEVMMNAGHLIRIKGDRLLMQPIQDIEEATAWKDGYFYFNNRNVRQIMAEIKRWYGVEVEYEVQPGDKRYVGGIKKSVTLAQVCDLLEDLTDYDYVIEHDKLIINKK